MMWVGKLPIAKTRRRYMMHGCFFWGPGGAGDPKHEMESALDISNEYRVSCGHSRFERGICIEFVGENVP
jgi:hypothetical protein